MRHRPLKSRLSGGGGTQEIDERYIVVSLDYLGEMAQQVSKVVVGSCGCA